MNRQFKLILVTQLLLIIFLSGGSNHIVTANSLNLNQTNYETNLVVDIESNAQRLSFQLDSSKNRHFIYQIGKRPLMEPDAVSYNGSHVLKYGKIVNGIYTVESVTDDLVFPYHYEFRIDSLEQVHLAYIANNYTLYYTIRNPSTGVWTTTQLTTSSEMFAMMPSIALGSNEQPRIVYSVRFQENGDLFFDQEGFEINTMSSLMYAVLTETTWSYFDINDNHSGDLIDPLRRNIVKHRVYNPGIKIKDGYAYIAFTTKVSIAVETRMQYIKIKEIPDLDTLFWEKVHQRAKIAPSQQTTYRRPDIHLVGEGVILAFGSWSFGGGAIIYLTNSSILQDPNPAIAADQWLKQDLLTTGQINRQIDSVIGAEDDDGNIFLIWSIYHLLSVQTEEFTHEIYIVSFNPTDASIGSLAVGEMTDTAQIHHYSPSIAYAGSDELIVLYLTENQDTSVTQLVDVSQPIAGLTIDTNSQTNTGTTTPKESTDLIQINTIPIVLGMSFVWMTVVYSRKENT